MSPTPEAVRLYPEHQLMNRSGIFHKPIDSIDAVTWLSNDRISDDCKGFLVSLGLPDVETGIRPIGEVHPVVVRKDDGKTVAYVGQHLALSAPCEIHSDGTARLILDSKNPIVYASTSAQTLEDHMKLSQQGEPDAIEYFYIPKEQVIDEKNSSKTWKRCKRSMWEELNVGLEHASGYHSKNSLTLDEKTRVYRQRDIYDSLPPALQEVYRRVFLKIPEKDRPLWESHGEGIQILDQWLQNTNFCGLCITKFPDDNRNSSLISTAYPATQPDTNDSRSLEIFFGPEFSLYTTQATRAFGEGIRPTFVDVRLSSTEFSLVFQQIGYEMFAALFIVNDQKTRYMYFSKEDIQLLMTLPIWPTIESSLNGYLQNASGLVSPKKNV